MHEWVRYIDYVARSDGKVRAFRKFADAGQYEFVPFALESYGRLGVSGQSFLKRLWDFLSSMQTVERFSCRFHLQWCLGLGLHVS